MHQSSHRRQAGLSTWLALALTACVDSDSECIPGTSSCKDGVAFNYEGGGNFGLRPGAWRATECKPEQLCIEAEHRAMCAISTRKEAQCESRFVYCAEDGRVVFCEDGYPTEALDCPAEGRTCADAPAQCVESELPDPRCPVDTSSMAFCEGDFRHECRYGYLTRIDECEAGCIKFEGWSHAACIHPDSATLCAPENLPTPAWEDFCSGEAQLLRCHEGLALEIENCAGDGRVCAPGPFEDSPPSCQDPKSAPPR
jgi:hypothetical protein